MNERRGIGRGKVWDGGRGKKKLIAFMNRFKPVCESVPLILTPLYYDLDSTNTRMKAPQEDQ